MDSTSDVAADDEWELCHDDDGFVYKRNRRRLHHVLPDPVTQPDPEEVNKRRRERKRTILLKLKAQYQKEIDQWEQLSNTLRAFEEQQSLQLPPERQLEDEPEATMSSGRSSSGAVKGTEGVRSVLDNLLLQVEAQEAIIQDVTNLCDIADAMGNSQEDQLKQSFLDLPIWCSSSELMTALCDD